MNKIVKILFATLVIINLLSKLAFCEFAPWSCDIFVGDDLFSNSKNKSNLQFTSGIQGGAYLLIRFFQVVISPQDGPNCRHIPTCSVYGKDAVLTHGALVGSILAGDRLIRCNPFYPPSKDPVPKELFEK